MVKTGSGEQLGLLTACDRVPLGSVPAQPGREEAFQGRPVRPSASHGLPVLDARARGTTFHEVPVKAILNSPASTGMGFWSLNPYVGCEFGCTYCYARETHRWRVERAGGVFPRHPESAERTRDLSATLRDPSAASRLQDDKTEPAWESFERRILVKTSAAAVLTRTLFPARLAGASLVIGTATDPYQPAERSFRLTRSILEALRAWKGLSLGIITKSPLILRDVPLLQELAKRHELSVNISLASVDAVLLRRLEARSPAPHARLRAVKGLVDAGIHAGIMLAPVIPGVSDSREALGAVMAAGKAAGARYVVGAALRLGPAARTRFLPHLAQEFPELVERYTRRFGHSESPGKDYTDALSRRICSLQREYGFPVNSGMSGRQRHGGSTPRSAPAIPQSAEQWTLL
jgi:DNA repair photolyase